MAFVELGCGESYLAIERILNTVISSRTLLPVAIFDRLTRWLDGYAGSPEEPRLRTMPDLIRLLRASDETLARTVAEKLPPELVISTEQEKGALL